MTLDEYLTKTRKRLPADAQKILKVLHNAGGLNKEELSVQSMVKRYVADRLLHMLYALGFVDIVEQGKSRICHITKIGRRYLQINEVA